MAKKVIKVRRNKDGTTTVRIGRYVEHLPQYLGAFDAYERLRWACITADMPLSVETMDELWRIARGLEK